MKEVLLKVLRNSLLSVVGGMLIWFFAHSLLLPVTDAGDSEGHGPDVGTVEWNGVIQRRAESYRRDAIDYGVISGMLAFTALTMVSIRRNPRDSLL